MTQRSAKVERVQIAAVVAGLIMSAPLWAQPAGDAPSPPPASRLQPVPTLDELLGLSAPGGQTQRPAPTATEQDLNDRLAGASLEDNFKEAIALMARASDRLNAHQDTGLDTQRIQEQAILKLDEALSEAKKRQQQQSQSRSQQQRQQQQQRQDQSQAQPDQPMSGEEEAQRQNSEQRSGDSNANLMPPDRMADVLNPNVNSTGAAWGNLPERLRNALLQGRGEKFSTRYARLTQEYYRRLAEQGQRPAPGTGASGGGGGR